MLTALYFPFTCVRAFLVPNKNNNDYLRNYALKKKSNLGMCMITIIHIGTYKHIFIYELNTVITEY